MPRSPSPRRRSVSPSREARRRSRSPRRDRDRESGRDRDRDYNRGRDDPPRQERDRENGGSRDHYSDRRSIRDDRNDTYDRPRSHSPPPKSSRRPKELSFYKKGSSSMGSFSSRRDPLDEPTETEKERLQRRERGEVPARFGGTRDQGVRNTMALNAPTGSQVSGMGSFRRNADPLDRISGPGRDSGGGGGGGGGGGNREGDRMREERMKAMDKPKVVSNTAAAARSVPSNLDIKGVIEANDTPRPQIRFIEVIANSRMGGKVRVKCLPTDTVGDLKRLIAAQTGTTAQKIQLKKWSVYV